MLSLIVAVNEKNVIGLDGKMPWHCPQDLAYFKRITSHHPIIMGRTTFESILSYQNKPLPHRHHFVLTHNKNYQYVHDAVTLSHDFTHLITQAKQSPDEHFIIGGGELYRQALPFVDRFYLSVVKNQSEGDTFFPEWNPDEWMCHSIERHDTVSFFVYDRKK